MENIREAIGLHLEVLCEGGSELPREDDLIIGRVRIDDMTGVTRGRPLLLVPFACNRSVTLFQSLPSTLSSHRMFLKIHKAGCSIHLPYY